jgi:hypothetical protein
LKVNAGRTFKFQNEFVGQKLAYKLGLPANAGQPAPPPVLLAVLAGPPMSAVIIMVKPVTVLAIFLTRSQLRQRVR